jgi:hypothetical protein
MRYLYGNSFLFPSNIVVQGGERLGKPQSLMYNVLYRVLLFIG